MLGGDEREAILTRALLAHGAQVTAVGYPASFQYEGLKHEKDVVRAVAEADVVIAPMTNTDERGVIKATLDPEARLVLDEAVFRAMGAGKALLIGMAKPIIEELALKHRVRLIRMADIDEVAILNSIPTAEGAILRAMQEIPVTLHGSRVIVLGFGRCGMTLARMLHGIGARVTVVAREPGQLARAYEIGLDTMHLSQLSEAIVSARVVFNTVPARVLTKEVLRRMPQTSVIVDVAAAPGGTDFVAAEELGIKAYLDLGIPGRVAPETAGEILARTIPDVILDLCSMPSR